MSHTNADLKQTTGLNLGKTAFDDRRNGTRLNGVISSLAFEQKVKIDAKN